MNNSLAKNPLLQLYNGVMLSFKRTIYWSSSHQTSITNCIDFTLISIELRTSGKGSVLNHINVDGLWWTVTIQRNCKWMSVGTRISFRQDGLLRLIRIGPSIIEWEVQENETLENSHRLFTFDITRIGYYCDDLALLFLFLNTCFCYWWD